MVQCRNHRYEMYTNGMLKIKIHACNNGTLFLIDFERYAPCFERSGAIAPCTRTLTSEMTSLGLGAGLGIKKRDLSALAARDSRMQRLCRYDRNTN